MIVLILTVMHLTWVALLMDIKRAFLHGIFDKDHKLYMEVPQGMEK